MISTRQHLRTAVGTGHQDKIAQNTTNRIRGKLLTTTQLIKERHITIPMLPHKIEHVSGQL
ncbi:hypothetical protein, partial [Bifidobacterium bombi]|uniref:hypothetical protein n=1 Tax=Bifidobacterium bombi TaxID=471511 RepID=UPI0019D3CFA2